MIGNDDHLFITSVAANLMDRYISCICVDDTSMDVLHCMRVIGVVCYVLMLKMHSANALVYAIDVVKNMQTPKTPYCKGDDVIAMQLSWGLPPTKSELE